MTKHRITLNTMIALTIVILSWSSSFVFIRLCLHSYSPGGLALFRYLIVSVTMLFFYFRLPKRTKPVGKQWIQLFFLGFFGIGLYMILLNYGEITVTASITSFIIGLNPVISMIWAMIFFNEKISLKRWLGVTASIIGLFIIAAATFHHDKISWGIILILCAVLCAGVYNVGQKPLLSTFHPIEVAAFSAWSGTLVMLVFFPSLIHQIPHASPGATWSVVYLGIVPGAIGYAAWSYAISSEIPASKVVLSLYVLPLFSTLLGWLMLGEMPATMELAGGCVVLLGALVATRY